MKLKNKSAIITGANRGFGFAVAKEFVEQGANIMICARDTAQLQIAQKELQQFAKGDAKIIMQTVDIVYPDQVNSMTQTALAQFGRIDILVANAGVHGTIGAIEEVGWDEWSQAIDINLKGAVLLCRALLPHFKAQRYGKIILLSGGGATKPMPFLSAYAASKAALVRFGETLAEEVKEHHIDVNSLAPGAMNTRLLDEILAAGADKVGKAYYEQSVKQSQSGGTPLEKGAALCRFLASAESDGITGKLISAVWDPWPSLPQYKSELENTDIYTLRRIVPTDRNKNWDENA